MSCVFCRLISGQSLSVRRVVPVLGVPDALVPLDMPTCQLNLFPGYNLSQYMCVFCVNKSHLNDILHI